LADLDLVAVAQVGRLDAAAVHEGAVEAPLVLDEPASVALDELGVLARDGDVVEEHRAVGRAADRRALTLRHERLAGAAAAGADDERRALHPDVAERLEHLRALLGAEGLRLFGALRRMQERTALRAVVRGLRVLEAALGAVDVAHAVGGAAFPARISVSDSTSTWSRTLCPPVFWSRATSSARRMSIFPCRISRRFETSCSSIVYSSIRPLRFSSDRVARSGSGSTAAVRLEGQGEL